MAITAAMPMMIPSMGQEERILLIRKARRAMRMPEENAHGWKGMVNCRATV